MKNVKLATRISVIITVVLAIGLVALWTVTNTNVSSLMRKQVLQEMDDAVSAKSEIVEQYVQAAESYVIGYAQSPELKAVLLSPDDAATVAAGQSYTENYAAVNGNLENIYLANYGSTVLVSYVTGPIGVTLREGDSLKQLQDAVFASEDIWNTGIMASPSTGMQVISMYYPIYNNGEPIGYVGGAIYAEELRNTLNALQSSEESGTDYMLLDAASNAYIFCADEEKIGAAVEDESVLQIIGSASANQTGHTEYKENGKDMLAVYKYMPDRNWVLVITTEHDVAFASINQMSLLLILLCAVVLAVIAVIVRLVSGYIAKDIAKISHIITELGTLDLSIRHKLNEYAARKDEVGMIASATLNLTGAVGEAMGLLKEKNVELAGVSQNLLSGAGVTRGSVENVERAINEIANSNAQQANDTQQAAESVLHIGQTIETTMVETEALSQYAENIQKTSEEMRGTVRALSEVNRDTERAIEEISAQTLSTNESAMKIKDAANLITSIAEETNLLSLNASIEAARAGEQGRGFAVVADQIQKLADQSNNSAKSIDGIINTLIEASGREVKSMQEMKDIMVEQSRQLAHTEEQFQKMYEDIEVTKQSVSSIYNTVKSMDSERLAVVDVVQNLSAIAQENAANTMEILSSTEQVNDMVKDISDASGQLVDVSGVIERNVNGFTV